MNKIAMLAAALLVGTVIGAPAALAQTTTAPNSGAGVPGLPGNKSGPAIKPGEQSTVRPDQSNVPGLPGSKSGPPQVSTDRMQRAQGSEEEDDEDGFYGYRPGMMGGPGMRGGGMMRREMMGGRYGGGMGRGQMGGPMMMRLMFSLMDADGDGKLTLQEWQAAHERIFKAMDTDHDGTVTMEEMVTFMRGRQ
jgi:EF hand